MSLRERLGIEHPVIQAGMGGGLARGRLAGTVSAAGGLGTIGTLPPELLGREITEARERASGRPIAVNVLLPFARPEHWVAAADADVVTTFWGAPVRRTDRTWLHQVGDLSEARAAAAAGVDGLIVQGVEAGGHVRGTTPALELLAEVRAALPGMSLWLAGGVAERADVEAALAAGADAAVAGTRFLLSEESHAHPGYRDRLLEAHTTVLTELFGAGWPAPHRVVPNAATNRWLKRDQRGPAWLRGLHRATARPLGALPMRITIRLGRAARPWSPMLGPAAPVTDDPDSMLDATPLYAGETVARIDSLAPAGDLVRELAGR